MRTVGRFELGETTGLDEDVVASSASSTFPREKRASARRSPAAAAAGRRHHSSGRAIPCATPRSKRAARSASSSRCSEASGPLGALVLQRRQPGEFSEAVVSLMQTFADQSAIALENARLFEEIAQKSRELEIASQHKSQFVANMSHELRTPLAAILGYAELMQEGFYEPWAEKSMDALTRIRSNGKHLLGLINTVLDIAKIESGQFSLNLGEYALESVVETVRVGNRVAGRDQEARAQDRRCQEAAGRLGRRAASHPGAAQPRRQRHQVHRHRRSAHHRDGHERSLHCCRD